MPEKRLPGAVRRTSASAKANFRIGGGETEAFIRAIFPGESEMAGRMRDFDWSTNELGPPQNWPENLRITVRICLTSRFPIVVWWGPNYTTFYNDAYISYLGRTKHPQWLGRSGNQCWHEIWPVIGPMLEGVFATGQATWSQDLLLILDRNLSQEEGYFTFSYGPILDNQNNVNGIFCACFETTEQVVSTRRLETLRHEFRTPLTLMLGPLEDELRENPAARDRLEIAHRNSLRLLKLVNTLLDFSRIEAGRIEASYEPTDLAAHTAELASVFRSAVEKAGLRLVVDCLPLPEPVYVDREMWEKIVLNLLSNAFKFTFEGEIKVTLRRRGDRVELSVSDTGVGVPEAELPIRPGISGHPFGRSRSLAVNPRQRRARLGRPIHERDRRLHGHHRAQGRGSGDVSIGVHRRIVERCDHQ
jgi:hypothetical protein